MTEKLRNRHDIAGFSTVEALLLLVILAAVAFVGAKVLNLPKSKTQPASQIATTVPVKQNVTTQTRGGETVFNDDSAKASFSYPKSWTETAIKGLCNEPNGCSASTDNINSVELMSPDRKVDLVWSGVSGVGGNCDNNLPPTKGGCPSETVVGTEPIQSSSGLFVVEGAIEVPNGQYQPFLAVQDSATGVLSSGEHGLWYQSFKLPSTGNSTLFFMDNGYSGSTSIPQTFSSLNQVKSYLESQDVVQANQILLSLKVGS